MSLLDTVEPDFEVENRPYPQGIVPVPGHGRYYCIRQLKAEMLPHGTTFYSRETVESLLSQCRKEALLEAAENAPDDGCERYLRRMAESDKTTMEGEK